MVKLHCHMCRGDQEIAFGIGASFNEAAKDLERKVKRLRPSLLLLDFKAAVNAVRNEHNCHVVTTGSKYGEFTIQRRNLYKEQMPRLERLRLWVQSLFN